MQHYTYKLTHIETGIEYIGVRSCRCAILNDSYMSSSKTIKKIVKVYGSKVFKKEILKEFASRELANEHEIYLHKKYDVAVNENYYNMARATSSGFNRCGVKCSSIHKARLSESHTGLKHSNKTRKIMSNAQRNPNNTRYGRVQSGITKKKIRDANLGKRHSPESIMKMRNRTGDLNPASRPIIDIVTNEVYVSIRAAAKKYGITEECLRSRITLRPHLTTLRFLDGG